MKVQTKITLLIVLVVAIFMGGLLALRAYDRHRFGRIADDRLLERRQSFQEFLKHHGEPLKTLTEYVTLLDAMVQAIEAGDKNWFEANVSTDTLAGYRASSIWIYGADGKIAYALDESGANLSEVPIPREAFEKIFLSADHLAHFFLKVSSGLMEIRAATVHPSKDFRRETPPRGFFFAGRLWIAR